MGMNKANIFICFFIVAVMITLTTYNILEDREYINQKIEERDMNAARIEAGEKEIERLTKEIEYRGSREFIEKIAREELGFVMKDEIIFNVKGN